MTCGLLAPGTAAHALPGPTPVPSMTIRSQPASPQVGGTVILGGKVTPVSSGSTVLLQEERKPGVWTTVKQVKTNALGQYTASIRETTVGARHVRARLGSSPTSGVPSSAIITVSVLRRPSKGNTFKSAQPAVSGRYQVGQRLTVKAGTWNPRPSKLTYRWLRNGTAISKATATSYVLTPADQGMYVTAEIRAARKSQTTARESITYTAVAPGTITPAHVTILGKPTVGAALSASVSGWSPAPTTVTYQWTRDLEPITGAAAATYVPTPSDAGENLAVVVVAHRSGYADTVANSSPVTVPELEPIPTSTPSPTPTPTPSPSPDLRRTFGDFMTPVATTVVPDSVATVRFSDSPPDWNAHNTLVRWDTPGAFAHSLDPVPYGTLFSAREGVDTTRPWVGGEYHVNNSGAKNLDVSFTVTGKKFAIHYWTVKSSDAMVWLDGVPTAAQPYEGTDSKGTGSWNWLVVTRTSSEPVNVRVAGPLTFTGVDFDSTDPVQVTAAPRFTLGVISDSMFESLTFVDPMTNSAGPMLSTLTGFRVWNMAEGSTGYINDGTGAALSGGVGYPGHLSSPYGSDRRIASITAAPIDALLVNGSINDLKWGPAIHRAAVSTFLDRVAAARPDLPVVLVGLEPLTYTGVHDQTDPRFKALNDNFAIVAAEHSNVVGVIDPYTADWLTGSGSSVHPAGDGNQDEYIGLDGIHYSAAGQAYYQGRIADELRPMMARLP